MDKQIKYIFATVILLFVIFSCAILALRNKAIAAEKEIARLNEYTAKIDAELHSYLSIINEDITTIQSMLNLHSRAIEVNYEKGWNMKLKYASFDVEDNDKLIWVEGQK